MESTIEYCALLLSILIALISTIYLISRYNLQYWSRKGVSQLSGTHWLFGDFKDAIFLRSPPGWHLKKLYHQSPDDSPYSGFYILQKPCLLLRNPEVIKQVFVKDSDKFPDRYFSGRRERDSIGMRNLFGMRGSDWRYLRRKTAMTLSPQNMKRMLPLMLENGKTMMGYINSLEEDGEGVKIIDGQKLNNKFTTDVIANLVLGLSTDSFNNPDTEYSKFTESFFYSTQRLIAMVAVFFLQGIVDVLGPLIYYDMTYFKKLFWKSVKTREKSDVKRGDYIDSLLKLQNGKQDLHYKFEGNNLYDLSSHLISGLETSSKAAAFTLLELAKDRDIQRRVRQDIRSAVEELGWTYEAFGKMKYLEQCVMEGMRLYPPVPFLDRLANEDYTIPGTEVVIEKGTGIYVSISALNREPKFFSHPDSFHPERFEGGSHKFDSYLPFGAGPKICIGSKLGVLHMKVVLALLLNEYEVTYAGNGDVTLDPRSTFTMADGGLPMELRKIS